MKKKAFIYIILAGILWGTSAIFVHYLTPYNFSSYQMAAIRGNVASVFMIAFALIKDRSIFKASLKDILLFALVGISLYGSAALYYTSMQMTSVSTSVILLYTAPLYVAVISALIFKERFTRVKIISVTFMLIGCCFVSGIIGGLKFNALGMLIGALSGVSYAAYNILTKIVSKSGYRPLTITTYSYFFMGAFALLIAPPGGIIANASQKPLILTPLLITLGVVTFVLPFLLYTTSMKYLPVGTVSALGIIEPMSATLFSVILFNEKLDVFTVIGILLILLAVFLLAKTEKSEE